MTEPSFTETSLALHIQEGHATDPAITAALVNQFAPGVHRFAMSLLDGHPDAPVTARAITQQTFAVALNDPDSFTGKENIRAWLYAQVLREIRTLPKSRQYKPNIPQAQSTVTGLESLSQQEYILLLLHYGNRFSLEEIAHLLRKSENKIHKHISRARQILIQEISNSINQQISNSSTTQLPSSHSPRKTQRLLDNLLSPEEEATFREHLETCRDCYTHFKQYTELENHLNTLLLSDPPLPQEQIRDIIEAVINKDIIVPKQPWQTPFFRTRLPFREMGWIMVAAVAFLILARLLNPLFSSPPPRLTPTPAPTATLPPAQDLSTVFRQNDPALTASNPFPGQHVTWSLTEVYTGDHIPTTPMVFSPSGNYAAFGEGTEVIVWTLDDFKKQTIYEAHQAIVTSLEFFPNENMLATGDEAGNILLWDLKNGYIRFRMKDHPGPIRNITISEDERYLALALNDGIWVWEMNEHSVILIQKYTWDWVRLVAFSPDGKYLTAVDRENTVIFWSFPDGKYLLRYQTLQNDEEHRLDIVTRLAYAPDGKKLATGSFDGIVEVVTLTPTLDGIQGTRLLSLTHPSWISEVRWSRDSSLLATVSDTGPIEGVDSASRALYLWNVESGTLANAPLTARVARGLSRAVFTSEGNLLLSSNFDGAIFEWRLEDTSHLVAAVPEPQFFTRLETNIFTGSLPADDLAIQFTDPSTAPLSFTPMTLSPPLAQYAFVNGNYAFNNSIIALSYQSLSGTTVTITQRPLANGELPAASRAIGASAVVQPVQIHGTMGEYVVGSWVLTYPDNPNGLIENPVYRWQTVGEARLRWIQGNLLMEIQTPLIQFNRNNLTMNELVRLAENMVAQAEEPKLLEYTVQDGDTCFGIALQFGTDVKNIAQANGLDNCDLIVVGQTLLIPLPTGRETVAETDLNCDGSLERVRAIPNPNLADISANFGVIVEAIPPGGNRFWPVWEWTITDTPVSFFGRPEIYTDNGCVVFLAVSSFSGISELSGLDLYRWDGANMELVLNADGFPIEVLSPNEGTSDSLRITTQSLVRDFEDGKCIHTTTIYQWNGATFDQLDQNIQKGAECLEG